MSCAGKLNGIDAKARRAPMTTNTANSMNRKGSGAQYSDVVQSDLFERFCKKIQLITF